MSTIQNSIQALLSHCDGARTKDNMGFNSFDSRLVRSWNLSSLTTWQERTAHRLLAKYAKQLASFGIDYSTIPQPAMPPIKPTNRITTAKTGDFMILFAYNTGLVSKVKEIPGRKWNALDKFWSAPLSSAQQVAEFALQNKLEILPSAAEAMSLALSQKEESIEASQSQEASQEFVLASGLGGTLRPFQVAGVEYASKKKRAFICDEMGLGKTIEALATLHQLSAFPALIICPASLKLNWEREAKKWLPGKSVSVINGKNNGNGFSSDVVIMNYDILSKHFTLADKKTATGGQVLQIENSPIHPAAVVLDESAFCKNYKAKRTELCRAIAKMSSIRLCLTGTPVLNRPQELLSQLQLLGRLEELGGFWEFAKRYCNAKNTRYGWDFSGASNLEELNKKLRASCFIRRKKEDVLKELPAKQRTILPVKLSNPSEYQKVSSNLISWVKQKALENKDFQESIKDLSPEDQKQAKNERASEAAYRSQQAETLVRIEALKQTAAKGKLEAAQEWIESFLETGEKLVVFAHHTDIVNQIAEIFSAPSITGSTPIEKRQEYVDRFQNDAACKIIVCNIKAGGVGITLTAASNVLFLEQDWTPAAHDQAEDRCHRIGQNDSVTAWYLLGQDTIDEDINNLIEQKRQVVDAVTEGQAGESSSILKDLIEKISGGTNSKIA